MAGSLQPGILPRPHELTALKNQKTQRSDRLPTRRPERFFIRPPKQTAQPRSKKPRRSLRGCRGATLPAFAQWPTPPTLQITNILLSREMHNRAAKETHRLLRGYRGVALPALARRSHTSNLQTSNILPSREMHNRAAKEPHRLLRGCRGATLPALEQRSRTSDSANKQRPARPKRSIGTLCATLNRNAQPRSKRTSPSLVGMQGSDAPRPRAAVAHLRFCKQATSSSSKANQHALPSIETSNRAAKESRCLLRGCRGATNVRKIR